MTVRLSPPAIRVQITPIPLGVIHGTTVLAGGPDAPVRRRVQIFQSGNSLGMVFPTSAIPVRWQWSAADGSYRFTSLDPAQTYGVIAYDHTGVHDPVIKLNLIPEVPSP